MAADRKGTPMTTTDENQLSDSELIAAALRHIESDDHARNTCQARYAPCSCGYTERGETLMRELAKRLETILARSAAVRSPPAEAEGR